jgi:hypothetical protein
MVNLCLQNLPGYVVLNECHDEQLTLIHIKNLFTETTPEAL